MYMPEGTSDDEYFKIMHGKILTTESLDQAKMIHKKELLKDQEKYSLWKSNIYDEDFEWDMEHHGPACIERLLSNHVSYHESILEKLEKLLINDQTTLMF